MYVKSLKELAIFAFAFNYDKLYCITDFDELSLQTREQVVQWLLDHDTGLLDKSLLQDRYEKRTWVDCSPIVPNSSADDAANRYRARQQQSSWRNVFHLSFRSRQKMAREAAISSKRESEALSQTQPATFSGSFDELDSMDELEYTIYRIFGETKLFANITRLSVTKSLMLCDELLMCFSQQCGYLRSVKLSHCLYITDEGFSHLVSNGRLNQLETLKIESCNNFCGSSLAQLDTDGNLVSICLKFLRLNWKAFRTFLSHNSCVKSVDLRSSWFMGHVEDVAEIPAILGHNLVCLVMPKTNNHRLERFMAALCSSCPNLRKLDLTSCIVEDIDELQDGCPLLEDLDLTFCVKLSADYFQNSYLPIPPSVKRLGLGSLNIQTESLDKLLTVGACDDGSMILANLTHVSLNGIEATAYDTNFLKQLCRGLGHQLLSISLNHLELPDVAVKPIATHCQVLQTLHISSRELTGETLKPFFTGPAVTHLTDLSLMCCYKVERSLLELVADKCEKLEKVELSRIQTVDDEILQMLALRSSRTLRKIGLGACRQVTDFGVSYLATNCDLTKISVAGINNITNTSIKTLARCCPTLTELYISGCSKITPEAITYIRDQCISRVYISHRNPNVHNNSSANESFSAFNIDSGEFVSVSAHTGIY